jgi:hypothetical protein
MSYLELNPVRFNYAVKAYPGLVNLERIMSRNDDRFFNYINLGNRTIPNQNPLVQFLQSFSVNPEWTNNELIDQISTRSQQIASLTDLTSLYSKGENHIGAIYPESNHNTLLVVPFGSPSRSQIDVYFSIPLDELVPLYPIYTTDTIQRWDIMDLINTQNYRADESLFTIVNVDVYALIIGFWRWLQRGGEWGNSPHGYLANFPLMNCYTYHNELVNFNYLNGNASAIDISKGSFNLENYYTDLTEYTEYKNRYMLTEKMQSFTEFVQINKRTNPNVNLTKMVFPDPYKSLFFVQMSWVWSLAALGMVSKYIRYNNILGTVDGQMRAQLNMYFTKVQLQSQLNQIPMAVWKKHFTDIWTDVKDIKP